MGFWSTMKRVVCCGDDRVDSCDDLPGSGNAPKKAKHSYSTRSKGEEMQSEPFIVDHQPGASRKTQDDRRLRNNPYEHDRRARRTPGENDRRDWTNIEDNDRKTRNNHDERKLDGQRRNQKKFEPETVHADINMPTESQRKQKPSYDTQKVEDIEKMKEDIIEGKDAEIKTLKMEIDTLKQNKETNNESFKIELEQLRKENERFRTKQGSQTYIDSLNREAEVQGRTKPVKGTTIGEIKLFGTDKFTKHDSEKLKSDNDALNYLLENYKTEITKLKDINDNMKTEQEAKTSELKNELERLKRNIKEKEAEITKLSGENTKLKSDNGTLNCDNEAEITKLKTEHDELKTKQRHEINELKNKIGKMKENIGGKETEITKLNREKDKLGEQKVREVDELRAEIETLRHKLEGKANEQTKLKEENDRLNAKQASEIDELKSQIETLKGKLEDEEIETTALKSRNEDLESKYDDLKASIPGHNIHAHQGMSRVEEGNHNEPLVEHETKHQPTKVQLYCPGKIELSAQATSLFSERLRSELDNGSVDFLYCHDSTDVSSGIPTVCLCVTVSRLGTDVVNAVQNIDLNSDVVLVILHHKAAHSIPAAASRQVLVDKRYQSLAGMFDLVFEKNIFHECNMNETNMVAIIDCLKKIMQKYQ